MIVEPRNFYLLPQQFERIDLPGTALGRTRVEGWLGSGLVKLIAFRTEADLQRWAGQRTDASVRQEAIEPHDATVLHSGPFWLADRAAGAPLWLVVYNAGACFAYGSVTVTSR